VAKFPSMEWAEQFCREVNGSEEYRRAARGWVWPILFIVEDIPEEVLPQGPRRLGLYVDLEDGACKGVSLVEDPDSVDAPFVIAAPYREWVELIRGGLDPIRALVTRRLRLVKGSFSTVLRYPKAAIELVRLAQEVGLE